MQGKLRTLCKKYEEEQANMNFAHEKIKHLQNELSRNEISKRKTIENLERTIESARMKISSVIAEKTSEVQKLTSTVEKLVESKENDQLTISDLKTKMRILSEKIENTECQLQESLKHQDELNHNLENIQAEKEKLQICFNDSNMNRKALEDKLTDQTAMYVHLNDENKHKSVKLRECEAKLKGKGIQQHFK